MNVDHDGLFKKLLTTFFAEFIELFFPEVHNLIDYSNLKFLSQEVFTDVTAGEKRFIDILAEVKIKGEDGCVLIHVEPQSYRQKHFNRRMFSYFCRLYEKHNKKVLPIAVFSHDSLVEEENSHEVSFPFLQVMRFEFFKVQLKRIAWRTFIQSNNPVAAALLGKMNYEPMERAQVKLQFLRMLVRLRLDPARSALLTGFFEQYCVLTPQEEQLLHQKLTRELPQEEVRDIMEITTSWHEKGRMEGRLEGKLEGRLEGRLEGSSSIIIKQAQKRFGKLPPDLLDSINCLSIEQLEALAELLLEVTSVEDLRRAVSSLN